jgi:hypothetical protein
MRQNPPRSLREQGSQTKGENGFSIVAPPCGAGLWRVKDPRGFRLRFRERRIEKRKTLPLMTRMALICAATKNHLPQRARRAQKMRGKIRHGGTHPNKPTAGLVGDSEAREHGGRQRKVPPYYSRADDYVRSLNGRQGWRASRDGLPGRDGFQASVRDGLQASRKPTTAGGCEKRVTATFPGVLMRHH